MGKNLIDLNEDERDCLQELMNIAYGEATAAISKIIDKFATLNIPVINTVTSEGLLKHLNEKIVENGNYFIANQLIHGNISGENLFIIDEKSSYNLTKEFGLEDDEIDDDEIKDVVLEITNIISSVTSGKLASLIDASISFSSPNIKRVTNIKEFNDGFDKSYENIIIISTELNFEDEHIKGELIILSKNESSEYLRESISQFLEDL
ncbi:chemotaxis protein CheX [Arcobacter roscoffensis]|uniref:Chemotaxis protein CheX n=1 Tax=Arcobacter roscoffensis TaxID=2961520 RepID=A0ABY5E9P0_9BACT|nr:chemotaxis protein CheX [Arcobacter roscoffensis]UTJ07433.1 chemotaxis protein CheX [Arcobacter roscoffensis]